MVIKWGCALKVWSNPPKCTYPHFNKSHSTLNCTNIQICVQSESVERHLCCVLCRVRL
jgi:hypothetical protein